MTRYVYLDEAGSSKPGDEPFFVVAGVIVDADRDLVRIEQHLARLRDKHCPDAAPDFVFHATDIYSGERDNGYFRRSDPRWSLEKRWSILDDLAAAPRILGLPIVVGAFDKAEPVPESIKAELNMAGRKEADNQLAFAHTVAMGRCALAIERWLQKNAAAGEEATIIAEDTPRSKEAMQHMHGVCQTWNASERPAPPPELSGVLPFRHLRGRIRFVGKREAPALQLADACVFTLKRYFGRRAGRRLREGTRFFYGLRDQIVDGLVPVDWAKPLPRWFDDFFPP